MERAARFEDDATNVERDIAAAIIAAAIGRFVPTTPTATAALTPTTPTAPAATPTTPWPWTGPQEPWYGRHRVASQFELGFRAGYGTRNPHNIMSPPPSVLAELLGHASWVVGHAMPGTQEHAIGLMTRDWLLEFY